MRHTITRLATRLRQLPSRRVALRYATGPQHFRERPTTQRRPRSAYTSELTSPLRGEDNRLVRPYLHHITQAVSA